MNKSKFSNLIRNGINKADDCEPIGCILHVGAGNGNELEDYLKFAPEEIILLEPIQRLYKKLQKKTLGKKVKVFNAALVPKTSESAKNTFYEVQPTRFSGLNKPNKLKDLFQNLKIAEAIRIDAFTLSDLLKGQRLNKQKFNVLVLQVNGSEYDCLVDVDKDALSIFSNLVIQISNNENFQNARPNIEIVEMLTTKGFQLDVQSSEDSIFQNFVFSKDKIAELLLINEKQESQISEISAQLTNASIQIVGLKETEGELTNKLKKKKAKLELLGNANQALVAESDQSKLELASTENEIQINKDELKKSVTEVSRLVIVEDKLVKQVIEMTRKLDELNLINQGIVKDRTTVQVSLEEAIIKLKQSEIDLGEIIKQRDEQGRWHQENKKWAESLQAELKKKEEGDKQQVLSRNLNDKLLAKAMIDADDLREQFREQKEREQELVNLIYELRNKLQTASSFYHKLQTEHPELLTLELNE